MTESKTLNPDIFKLDNDESLILYSDFLIRDVANAQIEEVIESINNGTFNIDDLKKNKKNKKKSGIAIIKTEEIEGIYTDVKHDDKVLLVSKSLDSDESVRKKLSFENLDEKNSFIEKIYGYIEKDFTHEIHKNTVLGSARIPLTRLFYTLLFGGACSWLIYYMKTAESYSFRVPIVFYFPLLIMERIGYIPIAIVTGVIALFFVGWTIKNMIVPTEKLVIERKK